jgi:hypothetical protein
MPNPVDLHQGIHFIHTINRELTQKLTYCFLMVADCVIVVRDPLGAFFSLKHPIYQPSLQKNSQSLSSSDFGLHPDLSSFRIILYRFPVGQKLSGFVEVPVGFLSITSVVIVVSRGA